MPVVSEPYSTSERIGALDGLRGIAILLVMIQHWIVRRFQLEIEAISGWFYDLAALTAYGVDVFFVVSGFLIGRILLVHSSSAQLLRSFYIRRFLRIIPLYYCVLCLFFTVRFMADDYPSNAIPIGSYFIFVNNFFDVSRWSGLYEFSPYWSLAIEEQFYIASALVVVAFGRVGVLWLAALFIGFSMTVRGAAYLGFIDIVWWPTTVGHADPIGIGLLVAGLVTSSAGQGWARRHLAWFDVIGVSCLLSFVVAGQFGVARSLGLGVTGISIAVACLIVRIVITGRGGPLSLGPLRRLGEMCFSLYILHLGWDLYVEQALEAAGLPIWAAIAVSFVGLVALCSLLWRYVETPLINYGRRWRYDDGTPDHQRAPA